VNEKQIYLSFSGKYIKSVNEYYVASDYASLFVDHVSHNSVRILGIEGFEITDKCTKPDSDVIADWSENEDIQKSIKLSQQFVYENQKKVSHFNFTLDL